MVAEKKHNVFKSSDPATVSADKGFFGCKQFSRTNELLTVQGLDPIDWNPTLNPPASAGQSLKWEL